MFKDNPSFRGSFFGNFVYDAIVPKNHPLRILKKIANFNELDEELKDLYSSNGQHAYPPSMMIRICILQYLYDLSDTKIMEMVKYNLPAKYYAGLSVDQDVPDPSLLTYFRKRLSDEYFNQIFKQTLFIANQNGLRLGNIMLIDSSHINAKIQAQTQKSYKTKDAHNDKDASFGKKNKDKLFFGYKNHIAAENNNKLITAVTVTPGNVHDSQEFTNLLEESEEVIAKPSIVSADKAYDSENIHRHLEERGIFSAIHLKKNRLQTRDGTLKSEDFFHQTENHYLETYLNPKYEQGVRERYKAEQIFAESKRYHGWRKSRYLGLSRNRVQSYLTATVINLKHIIKAMHPELHFYKVH